MPQSILKIASWFALLLTLVPSILVFAGSIEFPTHTTLMLAGTILWFITRPFISE